MPKIAVQRAVNRYRVGGSAAFFMPPKPRVGRKLTLDVLRQAQGLLDQGQSVPEISRATGGWPTRFPRRSALAACVSARKKDPSAGPLIRTQSQRRAAAQSAPLGCATPRTEERLLAAVGLLRQAPVQFKPAADVPLGGVLWALAVRLSARWTQGTPICNGVSFPKLFDGQSFVTETVKEEYLH